MQRTKDTYQRFYETLSKIISKRDEEIQKYEPLLEMLEKLGMSSAMSFLTGDQLVSQQDYDRVKLELSRFDIPQEEGEIFKLVNWISSRDQTWIERMNKVTEFQKANKISALESFTFNINGVDYDFYRPTDKAPLTLTENDMNLLEEQKPKAIRLWLEYCSNNNYPMYQLSYNSEFDKQKDFISMITTSQYNWQEISADYIYILKNFYKWAFLLENPYDTNYNLVVGNSADFYKPDSSAILISPTKYDL